LPYLTKKVIKSFVFNRNVTFRKLLNALQSFYYYEFSKNPAIKSYPLRLVIDTGNICSLKCPLCPTGSGRGGREKKFLKFEDFKKIIDEAALYLYEIDLYNWGEPFLNKDILKMIEYAKGADVKVNVNSNLNSLKESHIHPLIKSGLDELIVSLDGATGKSYSAYRVNGDFDIVMFNLKELIRIKRENKSRYPKIIWQFLVMSHNEHEIEKAKQSAKALGVDEIRFRPLRCDMGREIFMSDKEKIETIKEWLPEQERYARYDYKRQIRKQRLNKCLFLNTTAVLNADGSVSPCCGVYDKKWDFGNAFSEGILTIWNNEKYQQARKAVLNKDSSDKTLVCSYCIENGFLEY
jgi:radical SAM protein with 4Fe4S-binding SPASM domain